MNTIARFKLAAITCLCLGLVSCGNDSSGEDKDESKDNTEIDKGDGEGEVIEKRLVKIQEIGTDGNTISFSYNDAGKLIKVIDKSNYNSNEEVSTYSWSSNSITEISPNEKITYSISNSKVNSLTEEYEGDIDIANFYYSDSKLKKYTTDGFTGTYTWNDDKLVSVLEEEERKSNQTRQITYSSQTTKGYFPLTPYFVEDKYKIMLAHPELFGLYSNRLPESITEVEENDVSIRKFSYSFDEDGYVTSCFVTEGSDVDAYNFIWQ